MENDSEGVQKFSYQAATFFHILLIHIIVNVEAIVKNFKERNDGVNYADHRSDKHHVMIVFPSTECMSDTSLYKVTKARAVNEDG